MFGYRPMAGEGRSTMTDVPGLDLSGLQDWLRRAHPDLAGDRLSARVIAGGKSNLTYAIDGGTVPLVLRRPPLGHVLSSAHDMRREFRVISAVHGTGVPVPVALDVVDDTEARQVTGTTFVLMERAPGIVLSDRRQNARFTATGLRRLSVELIQHLADLHAVDPAAVGLAGFGRPDGYLDRQLATWRRQLDASRSRLLPELDALESLLGRSVPQSGRTGIVHGDYRLDNVLVVGEGDQPYVSAILDWEMATLGDPLVDLGIFALYWDISGILGPLAGGLGSAVDSTAGYPTFDELLDAYTERAGIPPPDLHWYVAFAAYKLAVIAEGIHVRYLAGETVGDGFERLGDLVEPLARHGLERHGPDPEKEAT
jgi:aminoglycoside phosphotransferase (APT) family kinase protein